MARRGLQGRNASRLLVRSLRGICQARGIDVDAAMPDSSSTVSRTAWLVVVLLMPVALLNYLDRQMLASMKSSVMADIPSIGTEANWGFMLGQFKWVYAFLSPIGGYVADRFSRRLDDLRQPVRLVGGDVVDRARDDLPRAAVGALADGHQRGVLHPGGAGAHRRLSHRADPLARGRACTRWRSTAGVIVGGFGGYVADAPTLGWRCAFDACGVVRHALRRAAARCSLRDAPQQRRARERCRRPAPVGVRRELLTNALVHPAGALLHAAGAGGLGGARLDAGDPQAAVRHRPGAGRRRGDALLAARAPSSARSAAAGWPIAGCGGPSAAASTSAPSGMGLIVPAIFGVGNAGSLAVAVAFLILFGLGWGFFDCNNMPILCQIVRPQLRATGYGIMNLVSISCGGLADWGFGVLRDRHVPLNVIFGVFAGLAVVSIVLVLLIRPRPELGAQTVTREN